MENTCKLSVIIPVYNEGAYLRKVLEYLFQSPCPVEREWIVIDDGSRDGSYEVLQGLQAEHDFRLLRQTPNQGKGAAVIRGIKEASGDLILIQDADFEYDPRDVPRLLEPLLNNQADAVYGSRFKKSALGVHRTYHYFANRFLTLVSNILSGIYLTDMETCYKILRSDLAKAMNLHASRFGIEVELTAYLAKTRARIRELPIGYYPRSRLQGKKIGWKDGLAALYLLARCNILTPFSRAFTDLPERYHPQYEHFYGPGGGAWDRES